MKVLKHKSVNASIIFTKHGTWQLYAQGIISDKMDIHRQNKYEYKIKKINDSFYENTKRRKDYDLNQIEKYLKKINEYGKKFNNTFEITWVLEK